MLVVVEVECIYSSIYIVHILCLIVIMKLMMVFDEVECIYILVIGNYCVDQCLVMTRWKNTHTHTKHEEIND